MANGAAAPVTHKRHKTADMPARQKSKLARICHIKFQLDTKSDIVYNNLTEIDFSG